jgi:hypothetical protein
VACAVLLGLIIVWTFMARIPDSSLRAGPWISVGLTVLLMGCYVWYAVAAGAAANALGERAWPYVTWAICGPIFSLCPIPFLSTVLQASPLAIKFILGNQLKTVIRERSLAD